jgi:hypothetical protein
LSSIEKCAGSMSVWTSSWANFDLFCINVISISGEISSFPINIVDISERIRFRSLVHKCNGSWKHKNSWRFSMKNHVYQFFGKGISSASLRSHIEVFWYFAKNPVASRIASKYLGSQSVWKWRAIEMSCLSGAENPQ